MNMKFAVTVENADVYIDGNWIAQGCYDGISVGLAIGNWLDNLEDEDEI